MSDVEVKREVQQFYDRVGWQLEQDGFYQNARYEDLRPVSREYIHRCHLRITPLLAYGGQFLLDAGSGPVQYPEYLTYSQPYDHRVCADISIVALQEARKRLGEHGLFVVADVANLPFAPDVFDGAVSLHTLHHLPINDQQKAYREIHRALKPGKTAVVVNGWTDSPLMRKFKPVMTLMERLGSQIAVWRGKKPAAAKPASAEQKVSEAKPTGTYIQKMDATRLRSELAGEMDLEIRCWRSVNVRFLRAVVHTALGGKYWLRLLYWLEDRYPVYFGENGQYPLVIVRKRA